MIRLVPDTTIFAKKCHHPKYHPKCCKKMFVEVPACSIRMIDSINFLPVALSELPKMFGLKELVKGYVPHLF
jgi:hypothetical protein